MDQSLGLRRLRQNQWVRDLCKQVRLGVDQFIQPHFVVQGLTAKQAVPGLTGVFRETPDSLLAQVENDLEKGVRKILLFGVPSEKKLAAFDPSFTASQIAELRKQFGKDIWIGVDVCLCSYTEHGQCGILNDAGDHVLNNETVQSLASAALAFAQAGADCVAPSDMMDGRVAAIRRTLDQASLDQTLIMSYSAKFNSKFYGPFRAAADSAPKGDVLLKDRATYQIDPARPEDAFLSSQRDANEGADILMVKPGLPYLDVLASLSKRLPLPWAVYEVSGEYAAIELMHEKGLLNGPAAHVEAWTALVRAGASMIISYGARQAREWL